MSTTAQPTVDGMKCSRGHTCQSMHEAARLSPHAYCGLHTVRCMPTRIPPESPSPHLCVPINCTAHVCTFIQVKCHFRCQLGSVTHNQAQVHSQQLKLHVVCRLRTMTHLLAVVNQEASSVWKGESPLHYVQVTGILLCVLCQYCTPTNAPR